MVLGSQKWTGGEVCLLNSYPKLQAESQEYHTETTYTFLFVICKQFLLLSYLKQLYTFICISPQICPHHGKTHISGEVIVVLWTLFHRPSIIVYDLQARFQLKPTSALQHCLHERSRSCVSQFPVHNQHGCLLLTRRCISIQCSM